LNLALFGFSDFGESLVFLKNGMSEFILILYIVRVAVDLHYFVISLCPIQARFIATRHWKIFCFWRLMEIWRAIPNVPRLSKAKSAEKGGVPLY